MNVELKQFWNRLASSEILCELLCSQLRSEFESESHADHGNPANLANWLCQRKAISRFQGDILLGSDAGKLKYGNYCVIEPVDSERWRFRGQHILTKHPVQLSFFSGDDQQALQAWKEVKRQAERLGSAAHPNVIEVHEWVAIPEYRFVVSEVPAGVQLAERIPRKSRVSHRLGITIVRQLAEAFRHLVQLGAAPQNFSEDQVFYSKSGLVRLLPELVATKRTNTNKMEGDDLAFRLGQVWYRIAGGRLPKLDETPNAAATVPKSELARLKKYDVPVESIQVLWKLLGDPSKRPTSFDQVIEHCDKQLDDKNAKPIPQTRPSSQPYSEWLTREPTIGNSSTTIVERVQLKGEEVEAATKFADADTEIKLTGHTDSIGTIESGKARSRRRFTTVAMMGSMLVVGCLVGAVALLTSQVPQQIVQVEDSLIGDAQTPTELVPEADPQTIIETETDFSNVGFVQQLIEDDGQTLWEAPTTGLPLDFSYVPIAPKIAISVRSASLNLVDGDQLLRRSFGSALNDRLTQLEQRLGVASDQIDQLLATFHSNDQFEYDLFAKVTLVEPRPEQELREAWSVGEPVEFEGSSYFQQNAENSGVCFFVTREQDGLVSQFAMASEWLIKESIESAGSDLTTGAMRRIVKNSDRDRHVNAIVLRAGLFNDEGQKLMGPSLASFNRQLSLVIDEPIRAINLNLHLDQGTFAEVRFDTTADLKSTELQEQLNEVIESLETNAESLSTRLSDQSFWNQVRDRMGAIGADLSNNIRCGIEDRQVICNGWFPSSAAHNWIASAELLLVYGDSTDVGSTIGTKRQIPKTLEELLQLPRDLSVNTSPDLILLLNNLQQEIQDDYGQLPFKLEIRLMGSDLSKEGITQNQRPADFEMLDRSLADILTEIMVKANPDKNITGPDDIDCKMVWVIAPDPQNNDNQVILITTRSAAEANSHQLPPAFIAK